MRISTSPIVAPVQPAAALEFRPPTGEVAFMDMANGAFLSLHDTQTGYGRPGGYESLADARRAATLLTTGASSPAAGVFAQGERYYVRALGGYAAQKPHDDRAVAPAPSGPLQVLHFEGNADAHFGWVRDKRLVLVVDGATKIWSKDAHHTPPVA